MQDELEEQTSLSEQLKSIPYQLQKSLGTVTIEMNNNSDSERSNVDQSEGEQTTVKSPRVSLVRQGAINRPEPLELGSQEEQLKLEANLSVKRSPFCTPQTSTSNDLTFVFANKHKDWVSNLMEKDKDWLQKIEDGKLAVMPSLDDLEQPYTRIPEEVNSKSSGSSTPPPLLLPIGPRAVSNFNHQPPSVEEINIGLQKMMSIDPVSKTIQSLFPMDTSPSNSMGVEITPQKPKPTKPQKDPKDMSFTEIVEKRVDDNLALEERGKKSWMTEEILQAISVRDELFQQMKDAEQGTEQYHQVAALYKKQRNQVVTLTRRAKRDFKNSIRPCVAAQVHRDIVISSSSHNLHRIGMGCGVTQTPPPGLAVPRQHISQRGYHSNPSRSPQLSGANTPRTSYQNNLGLNPNQGSHHGSASNIVRQPRGPPNDGPMKFNDIVRRKFN